MIRSATFCTVLVISILIPALPGKSAPAGATLREMVARFTPDGVEFSPAPRIGRGEGEGEVQGTRAEALTDIGPVFALVFVDRNPDTRMEAAGPREARETCLRDAHSATDGIRVRTGCVFAYRHLWPGVDLYLEPREGDLKYELHVAPGADPARIRLAYSGIDALALSETGGLVARTARGEVTDAAPSIYQEIGGSRIPVRGGFRLEGASRFGFEVGPHDGSRVLVIDPQISYSTYLGGPGEDRAQSIAFGPSGSMYVTGTTRSPSFPLASPYQATHAGGLDLFVTKIFASGTSLDYSTYLGGNGDEEAGGIAVAPSGTVYLAGHTHSTNFPTKNAYQATCAGGCATPDAFATKLVSSGDSLSYSTFLGGGAGDEGVDVRVDSTGSAYVFGDTESTNFPVLGAYQSTLRGQSDIFVTVLTSSGTSLEYSTYLGSPGADRCDGGALDDDGSAYVVGRTNAAGFPTRLPYQGSPAGVTDTVVTKISPSGSSLEFSTYLGGGGNDYPFDITVGSTGLSIWVAGATNSTNFPTKDAYQAAFVGGWDAFVTKFSLTALGFSTYLGGSADEEVNGIGIDAADDAYVAGYTSSPNFPTKSPYQSTNGGSSDAFVAKLARSGSSLAYSTYLGGSGGDWGMETAIDSWGNAYVAGLTDSTNFPTKNPYQASLAPEPDAFVTRFPGRGVGFGSADFNGDHQDEIGVFRNGMWFLSYSNGYGGVGQTTAFGSPIPGMDSPELGEFNCIVDAKPDGQTDLVVLRNPFSTWELTLSPTWGSSPDLVRTFATTDHKKIRTRRVDMDGDGCSDIGVFRNGCFDFLESPTYVTGTHVCFGPGTDAPLAADLDRDGKSDLILWRAASAHYTYRLSSETFLTDHTSDLGGGDISILGDLDGDGRVDLGSYKPSVSTFRFSYGPDFAGVDLVKTHGVSGDIPIVADVNGDGVSDIGVFRNAIARWWFLCSPSWASTCLSQSFGVAGDIPIFGKPSGIP